MAPIDSTSVGHMSLWTGFPDELYLQVFGDGILSFPDLESVSLTCHQWRRLVEEECVGKRLLLQLPPVPSRGAGAGWMPYYAFWCRFPVEDEYTTYDYQKGDERRRLAESGNVTVGEGDHLSTMGTLFVARRGYTADEVVGVMSWDITVEFGKKSVKKWGPEMAKLVLSASQTATLYWNIIYYCNNYEAFLRDISNKRPRYEDDL